MTTGTDHHEDAAVHAFMAASLPEQRAQLTAWGLPADAGLLILMSACYGRCFFCAHPGVTNPPPEMITPWDRISGYLAGFRGSGVTELCLGGTEPSTHPKFRHTLALARKAGVERVQLMTSGVTLSRYATRWKEAGVASVCVPLYGAHAATHDAIVRVDGHHAKVLAGLDAARDAGIETHIHTIAMRRSASELAPLSRLVAERWGAPLHVAPLRPKEHVFTFEDAAMTDADLDAALGSTRPHLLGFPDCVRPDLPRDAPLLLVLYFRGQQAHRVDACATCSARATCPGMPDGWALTATER